MKYRIGITRAISNITNKKVRIAFFTIMPIVMMLLVVLGVFSNKTTYLLFALLLVTAMHVLEIGQVVTRLRASSTDLELYEAVLSNLPDRVFVCDEGQKIIKSFSCGYVGEFAADVFDIDIDVLNVAKTKIDRSTLGVHTFTYTSRDSAVYEVRAVKSGNHYIVIARNITSLAMMMQAIAIASMSPDELLYMKDRETDADTGIINRSTS